MARVSHVFVCVNRGQRFNPGADLNQSEKIYVKYVLSKDVIQSVSRYDSTGLRIRSLCSI